MYLEYHYPWRHLQSESYNIKDICVYLGYKNSPEKVHLQIANHFWNRLHCCLYYWPRSVKTRKYVQNLSNQIAVGPNYIMLSLKAVEEASEGIIVMPMSCKELTSWNWSISTTLFPSMSNCLKIWKTEDESQDVNSIS